MRYMMGMRSRYESDITGNSNSLKMILQGTVLSAALIFTGPSPCTAKDLTDNQEVKKYADIIRTHIYSDYQGMFREAGGALEYPFITPGSNQYSDVLWDWDSWLSNIALRQILSDSGTHEDREKALEYERGCILNYLSRCSCDGWIPVKIGRSDEWKSIKPDNIYDVNMHKPCLAQHAAFLVKESGNDVEWLRESYSQLQFFVNAYKSRYFHRATGLYFWKNDEMIGVDNDPCTYYRPDGSSGSIYLNCLMYKELKAMSYLAGLLGLNEIKLSYEQDSESLKNAITTHCWDERDGFYYSVDLNLKPAEAVKWTRHSGAPRSWDCLIQRIGVWSGFLAMWSGIATEEQAARMVKEHFENESTFNAPFGIRTLSRMEKMYDVRATGNPSSWLGPIWGISNYMVWRGLADYGFYKQAKELAEKTIVMFGKDFERSGALHEYYQPENGEPILNKGFQNWNYLVMNMISWIEGKEPVKEF